MSRVSSEHVRWGALLRVRADLPMAAIVLELGVDAQSPKANMFG